MKSTSKKYLKKALIAAASALVVSSAFATTILGTTSVQVGGKVQSVDMNTRAVTFVNAQGGTEAFQVGTGVPNLDKLKAGTNVTGTVQRGIRMTVLESSKLAAVPSQSGDQTVARVTRVDAQRGLIGLMDTQGAELTVQANSPAEIRSVVPGTRVLVDVTSVR
jgi:hypothetical protein